MPLPSTQSNATFLAPARSVAMFELPRYNIRGGQCFGIFLAVLLTVLFAYTASAHAQQSVLEAAQPTGEQLGERDLQALEELIVVLESETGRQDLIENLKTILEARRAEMSGKSGDQSNGDASGDQGNESEITDISAVLGIQELANEALSQYKAWLQTTGIQFDTATSIGVIVCLVLGWILIMYVLNVLTRRLASSMEASSLFKHGGQSRLRRYTKYSRVFLQVSATVCTVYLILVTLNVDIRSFGDGTSIQSILTAVTSVGIVVFLAILVYEAINLGLSKLANRGSNRLQTVVPLLRNVLTISIVVFVTLVALSELGIDIVPLLAGAGVLGIAVGFGAQTLVKDLLSGIIIIVEDLFQVGDWVALGGSEGTVENITFRKVDLRDLGGAVHTVPFGSIDTVRNLTKDYSFAVLEIGVAYREDTDVVSEEISSVAAELREDDDFSSSILEDLQIMGIDALGDSAVVIKVRFKTKAGEQWTIAREMRRRVKQRFDETGIEIPFPHQTIYFGTPKSERAPPAIVRLVGDDGAAEKPAGQPNETADIKPSERTAKERLGDDATNDD